jgi:Ca2+-binding EF-hand superfamily protein
LKTFEYGDRTVQVQTVNARSEKDGVVITNQATKKIFIPKSVSKFSMANTAMDVSDKPTTVDAQYAELAKKDPGVAKLFATYDENRDRFWQMKECRNAMVAMIHKHYLPTNLDADAECLKLSKEGKGAITLQEFVTFAKKTAAHSPAPADKPKENPSGDNKAKAKSCAMVFAMYDRNQDGGLNKTEFESAFSGKISQDAMADIWHSTPHAGVGNSVDFSAFKPICMSVTGLPGTDNTVHTACDNNPCTDPKTVCVPSAKVCFALPCPQYLCVARKQNVDTSKPTETITGRCMRLFHSFDADRSRSLTKHEFLSAIRTRRIAGEVNWQFDAKRMWYNMDKNPDGTASASEFIHFCVPVFTSGDSDAALDSECWDVFTAFDKDEDHFISKSEFIVNMRSARSVGHIPAKFQARPCWEKIGQQGKVSSDRFIAFCKKLTRGLGQESCNVPGDKAPAKTVTVATVTTGNKDKKNDTKTIVKHEIVSGIDPACNTIFGLADTDKNGKINLREFAASCRKVSTKFRCFASSSGTYLSLYRNATNTTNKLAEGTPERAVADVAGIMSLEQFNKLCLAERDYHLGKKNDRSKTPSVDTRCKMTFQQADSNANKKLNLDEFAERCTSFSSRVRCKDKNLVHQMFANATGQAGKLVKGSVALSTALAKDAMTSEQFQVACLSERPYHAKEAADTSAKAKEVVPNPQCDEYFNSGDVNHDAKLSISEFQNMCQAMTTTTRCKDYIRLFVKYTNEDGTTYKDTITTAAQIKNVMTRIQFTKMCNDESKYKTEIATLLDIGETLTPTRGYKMSMAPIPLASMIRSAAAAMPTMSSAGATGTGMVHGATGTGAPASPAARQASIARMASRWSEASLIQFNNLVPVGNPRGRM